MAEGYIQGASAYEIVSVLSTPRPEQNYQWAWQSALEVGCALMTTHHIRLAPSPSGHGIPSGVYASLLKGLSDMVVHKVPSDEVKELATHRTKEWARKNGDKLRRELSNLKADEQNFGRWLHWNTTGVWTEMTQRMDGLVDPAFVAHIARILGIPKVDLASICLRARDPREAAHFAHEPDTDQARMLSDAFVLSALIRGRYYNYVAQQAGWQILHHPVRSAVLPPLPRGSRNAFPLPNSAYYLSNVLLAAAFAESSPERRVALWAENVHKARMAVLSDEVELPQKPSDDSALSTAVDAAKRIGITAYPRRTSIILDEVLNLTLAVGVGALTSFLLMGWESLSASMIAYGVSREITRRKKLGERVLGLAETRRLRDMATLGPGRIGRTWQNTRSLTHC